MPIYVLLELKLDGHGDLDKNMTSTFSSQQICASTTYINQSINQEFLEWPK